MKPGRLLKHEFVEFIPNELKDDTIYVSIPYGTVVHKCCCGCGTEVVTPLSPTDWTLIFDGESISLDPSIGNWSFDCKSHYWIWRGRVHWAERWSQKRIKLARFHERAVKETSPYDLHSAKKEKHGWRFWHRIRVEVMIGACRSFHNVLANSAIALPPIAPSIRPRILTPPCPAGSVGWQSALRRYTEKMRQPPCL